MNKHLQSRAVILQAAGIIPETSQRKVRITAISDQDYAAVPPPLNLQVHPAGDCLIWLRRLNADGYGTASFPNQQRLAHRQAFTQSRGRHPNLNVLHLCHRPFCIQPSHLYDGSAKENSQDRSIRTSQEFHVDLFNHKSEIVQAVAKYRWQSSSLTGQDALLIIPAEHSCDFIIPAMDRLICPTCGRDNLSDDTESYFAGALQPDSDTPNIACISKRSRSFKNLGKGIIVETNTTSNYSIPSTRAERRRREKAVRKSPSRDKPLLLGSTLARVKPGETAHLHVNRKDLSITGPGIVLLTATPIKPNNVGPHLPWS